MGRYGRENEVIKCHKKRGIRNCKDCCRFEECFDPKPIHFQDIDVDTLIGAIVWSALVDYFTEIPPVKMCKTKAEKEARRRMVYNKGTAENFFKGNLFKYSNLDLEWLRRVYEKKKIQEE